MVKFCGVPQSYGSPSRCAPKQVLLSGKRALNFIWLKDLNISLCWRENKTQKTPTLQYSAWLKAYTLLAPAFMYTLLNITYSFM